MTSNLPLSRSADLVVQELPNEILVYDLTDNTAMTLNSTCAFIWRHCDGKTSIDRLAKAINENFDCKIDEDFIWIGINELRRSNLLKDPANVSAQHISRRKVLLKYALPIATLPVIISIIAPTSAQAESDVCVAYPSASCWTWFDCDNNNTPGCGGVGRTCSSFVCGSNNCCSGT